ncbi:MAG TPA: pyridoxal-5'-phosphate-dependent protein subunit beta, partial [Acidimicrobiales bacterium]|nr:pyridoxal-5'-phosphate-dependent protein subunit beta [Acidimicrobiales bacterium]
MRRLGLEQEVVDSGVYERTVERFRERVIALPTFAQLADPTLVPESVHARLGAVGPDDAHPLNLFRVHWYNDAARSGRVRVPEHVVLPPELTGTEARIVVALANRFPMIRAHKVLAS